MESLFVNSILVRNVSDLILLLHKEYAKNYLASKSLTLADRSRRTSSAKASAFASIIDSEEFKKVTKELYRKAKEQGAGQYYSTE